MSITSAAVCVSFIIGLNCCEQSPERVRVFWCPFEMKCNMRAGGWCSFGLVRQLFVQL